jgi:hypothetical protein
MPTIPDHDRQLVAGLSTYLKRATEALSGARPETGFGQTLPLVVLLKALRGAVAIVVLIERGYADEAGPLLRALAAATITFAALTQDESEDRGYLYARHGRDRHMKWIDSMRQRTNLIREREQHLSAGERTRLLTDDQLTEIRAQVESQWNRELEEALGGRIEPNPLGGSRATWSRLDDAALAERADALEIYRGIYDVASDSSHSLFTTLRAALQELNQSGTLTIGPTYASATYLAMGLRDCVGRLLADAIRHFGLTEHTGEVAEMQEEVSANIRQYAAASGDQAQVERARQLLGVIE